MTSAYSIERYGKTPTQYVVDLEGGSGATSGMPTA